ncbi:MAG: Fe(3+) dicitrate transport protein FecA [Haliscomenobacter sp.]|nr:Fe(3+) dicitrate transport protein FecA [Haliscomenobacter sp.]
MAFCLGNVVLRQISILKFYPVKRIFLLLVLGALSLPSPLSAQNKQADSTLLYQDLAPVTIKGYRFPTQEIRKMEDIHQSYIASGIKNAVIVVQDLAANLAEKTGRQVFSKIPGAFVYDMDGSGNQVNISTRGLDPHRSWEFNVRQNGMMTNSDIYGYPASHYSPPMESVQLVELIHGTASLQYGSQFGGMINYVTKQPDTSRSFSFEGIQSVGSYGLLSTYNALGGRTGKLSYYAYYHKRVSDGYRDNSRSDSEAQFASLSYAISSDFVLKAELGRSTYLFQIPGPLTDSLFHLQPTASTRSRNYFNPDIYLPSLSFTWKTGAKSSLDWNASAVLGTRKSVQFISLADVRDTIDRATLAYKARQVDIDEFNSYASEGRFRQDYSLGHQVHSLVLGFRYTNNNLHRRQLGKGTTGTDFDLTVTDGKFGRDVLFITHNVAVFAENLIQITPKLQVTPGIRLENGVSKLKGQLAYYDNHEIKDQIVHRYALLGIRGQYLLGKTGNDALYGGWSQAYRPVVLADVLPPTVLDVTDPALKDAFGHTAEVGIKGEFIPGMYMDLTAFQILYQNRIGSLAITDATGKIFILKTNIGDSRTNGVELFLQYLLSENLQHRVSFFTATSYMDGRYLNGSVRNGSENKSIKGNRVETTPEWISRNGLHWAYKALSGILQYSYVSESFSDALNTRTPTRNGASGLVPGYGIWDLHLAFQASPKFVLKAGINNLANKSYFTKRPTGYPGQGVWSSDGRSVTASAGFKF